ncbi:MAG: CoB--CoM heterodisulfide reductase subunit C [archaeon]|nr:CoB--CoM heterodisulfide reductase subunit C [archaeon]
MVLPNPDFVSELALVGGGDVMKCFQCGTCTASCPSGRNTAYRTRKLMRMAQLGLKDAIIGSEDLWQCTTCYTCAERCPRSVPIVDIVVALRNIAVENGKMFDAHKKTGSNLLKFGHTVSINDKIKAQRVSLGLPEVPPTVLSNKKAKEDFDTILQTTEFDKLIG